jgi:hypothetical protein
MATMQTTTLTNPLSSSPFSWFFRPRTEQTTFSDSAAIADHKWFLSERLGRDVGFSVAALDYRINVLPALATQRDAAPSRSLSPAYVWFLRALERLGESHGAGTWARLPERTQMIRRNS